MLYVKNAEGNKMIPIGIVRTDPKHNIVLEELTITKNGNYVSESGKAYKRVNVLVPPPEGEKNNVTIVELPQAPIQLEAGNTLSDISISGGVAMFREWQVFGTFTWTNPETIVTTTGSFPAIFTPFDTDAFNIATLNISVTVAYTPPIQSGILQITRQVGISDPEWTKVGDNALLVANANKLSSAPSEFVPTQDDYFDNPTVPVYGKIKICNVSDETGEIVSYLGDPDFRWNGENNTSVYTYYPQFYFRRRRNGEAEEIAVSEEPLQGGVLINEFLMATFGMKWETITLSDATTKEVLRSYAGLAPNNLYVDGGVNTARTRARATAGDNASGGDWRAIVIGLLHVVKYGTNNIQSAIGTGRSTSRSGNTGQGDAHLTLQGRDGYIGSATSTSIWSLGICDFYSHKGILIDGIYSTGVDNRVRFCSEPSKFVQTPAEEQDGYYDLGYEMSYSNGYTTETGIDDTNENPVAQIIPLRVNGDINATSSTGTTDEHYCYSSYRYAGYAGVYYNNTQGRGVFAFLFFGGYYSLYCSARVLRPITL